MEVEGQRPGSINLYFEGFSYVKRSVTATGGSHWKCSIRNCPGRLKKNAEQHTLTVRHDHDPDFYLRERKEVATNLKRLAAETYRPFQEIFEEETAR
jgi:hypothetical protein